MIPVVDLRGSAECYTAEISDALESIGFVAVTGHGIPAAQFETMRSLLRELFDLPDNVKTRDRITRDNYRGFVPLGFFTPNRDDPNAPAPDRYEAFKLHWEVAHDDPACAESPIYGPNRWVPEVSNMRSIVLDYWASCDRLAGRLLGVLERTLGLDAGALQDRFTKPVTNMTLLHYPPTDPRTDAHGIHPHKDTNVLTVLHPDPVGGLFVRTRAGEWHEAHCPDDALLLNVGDMLEIWSGGRFVSTPHKVVNATGSERYSFPWFLAPNHDEVIAPLVEPVPGFNRVDPIHVGDWSLEVWRTNWPDAAPVDDSTHLGTLDFD